MMPDGKSVAHSELMIGNSKIMLYDEFPEMKCLSPASIGGSPVSLYLYVEDVDNTFNLAISKGAKSLFPVQDMFYGDRHGSIPDPFGHIWSIATHIKGFNKRRVEKGSRRRIFKNVEIDIIFYFMKLVSANNSRMINSICIIVLFYKYQSAYNRN